MPIRGNLDTRLAKVEAGEVDATLLAAAGLDRLGRRSAERRADRRHAAGTGPGRDRHRVPRRRWRNLPQLPAIGRAHDFDRRPRRARLRRRAGRHLPFAGRGAGPGRKAATRPFAGRDPARGRQGGVADEARFAIGTKTPPQRWPGRCSAGRRTRSAGCSRPVRRLIILRPEPGASATAAEARAMGLEARIHPLVRSPTAAVDGARPGPVRRARHHQRQCDPPRRRRAGNG